MKGSLVVFLIKAMACGKPVIVTSVADVPFLVKNGVNDIVIPPGRADLLAESMIHLAESPELRKLMGEENAIKMAEYDWDKIAKQYHLLYLEIIHA
jgi:glycosyltransferase involved in cell wall biosynthesis